MIRIHNFARGARGLGVTWQCEEMGLAYEPVSVTFPPSDAYRALHSLGNVPFLEDDGGVAIHESIAIMQYLAMRYGPTPLLPGKEDPTLARVLELMVFSEASIGAGVNTLLAAHFGAPEADKRNWSVIGLTARIEKSIGWLETTLGDRPFLTGEAFTLADIAVSTALGIWRGALGRPLSEPLVAWRGRLAERPAYRRAAARQAPRA
jgi:glutathione S-transferase